MCRVNKMEPSGIGFETGTSLYQPAPFTVENQSSDDDDDEEDRRIEGAVAQGMEGLFDGLDMEDDESTYSSPPPPVTGPSPVYQDEVQTPRYDVYGGQQPPVGQYVTSTPCIQSYPVKEHFQQLDYEETNDWETPLVKKNVEVDCNRVDPYFDLVNKSDSEKVMARLAGAVFTTETSENIRQEREREVAHEERWKLMEIELRKSRHNCALAQAESSEAKKAKEELDKVLEDQRRQNQILTDEIHRQNSVVASLTDERNSLEAEVETSKGVQVELQNQVRELQVSDTVLRARNQHDATVRSLQERHKEETARLRGEADKYKAMVTQLEMEVGKLQTKLTSALGEQEITIRSHSTLVRDLQTQLEQARSVRGTQEENTVRELDTLKGELRSNVRQLEQEMGTRKRLEAEVEQLKGDLAGLEALVGGQASNSDSMLQLGLSGAGQNIRGAVTMREELHRSLVMNRTKREEISKLEDAREKLETQLKKMEIEMEDFRLQERRYIAQVKELQANVDSLKRKLSEVNSREEVDRLKENVGQLEEENVDLKKQMSEMVTANEKDKLEAIDDLRETYDANVREAIQATKELMEGEVKKLNLELDVYNQTLMELRNNLSKESDKNLLLLDKIKILEQNLSEKENNLQEVIMRLQEKDKLSEAEKKKVRFERSSPTKGELEEDHISILRAKILDEIKKEQEVELEGRLAEVKGEVEQRMEEQFGIRMEEEKEQMEKRMEQRKVELRGAWEVETKREVEEAVCKARLEWIKGLPEAETVGGAARISLGEVDRVKDLLEKERKEKEGIKSELEETKKEVRLLKIKEKDAEREVAEGRREAKRETEERLGREIRETLLKQQQQWERIVLSGREEAELQMQRMMTQWEGRVEGIQHRLNRAVEERNGLQEKLQEGQQGLEKLRKEWEGQLVVIHRQSQESKNKEIGILREELERTREEMVRQRQEIAVQYNRCQQEVDEVQELHRKDKNELEEVSVVWLFYCSVHCF